MNMKKLTSAVLAAVAAFTFVGGSADAATRDEIAAIKVSKKGNFQYWTKDSEAKKILVDYVKDVTNPKSKNFIPVKDRIATFDCDGTLMCETAPFYFDWLLQVHRINDSANYKATAEEKALAQKMRTAIDNHTANDELDDEKSVVFPKIMAGLTPDEYRAYIKNYINTTYVEGLSNLKTGEAFYLPMAEVVSYLNANDFTVYIVSGCERETIRALVDGIMDIEPNHIIGTDHSYTFAKQGNKRADRYFFKPDDKFMRGDKLLSINVNGNKIFRIQTEIGKKPVLAFGNSMGDASMFEFTLLDNKYKSAAFVLLCDDTERELGNVAKAEKVKKTALQYGWVPVSMKNDFATIYGDKVKREAK